MNLPFYGLFFLGLLIMVSISGVILIRHFSKSNASQSKKMFFITSFVIIICICLIFILQAKDEKHRKEIVAFIERKGGQVITIQLTEKRYTPFKELDERAARKKDDYYLIEYSMDNQIKTAWFKGDNALFSDTPTPEYKKWIFDTDSSSMISW
ncbi:MULTISPECIES: hypothetical protein [Paenibacillus]|uniref:hypothetical protein n=1 Tax=Paenibacillus TaxID=44249 RepID=UPI0022B8B32D|nr:hypothetical protein [Paenibacillus caseinilyticus]MCZ8520436.1 hypothetical protein [Paenibacillus caseinilyticus]